MAKEARRSRGEFGLSRTRGAAAEVGECACMRCVMRPKSLNWVRSSCWTWRGRRWWSRANVHLREPAGEPRLGDDRANAALHRTIPQHLQLRVFRPAQPATGLASGDGKRLGHRSRTWKSRGKFMGAAAP